MSHRFYLMALALVCGANALGQNTTLPVTGSFPNGAIPINFTFLNRKFFSQVEANKSFWSAGRASISISDGEWFFSSTFPDIGNTVQTYPQFDPYISTFILEPAQLLRVARNTADVTYQQKSVQPYMRAKQLFSQVNSSAFNNGIIGKISRAATSPAKVLGWKDDSAYLQWFEDPQLRLGVGIAKYRVASEFTSQTDQNNQVPSGRYEFDFPAAYQSTPNTTSLSIDLFPEAPRLFGGRWVNGALEFDYTYNYQLKFGIPNGNAYKSFFSQSTGISSSPIDTDQLRVLISSTTDGARFFPRGPGSQILITVPDIANVITVGYNQKTATLGPDLGGMVISTSVPGDNNNLNIGETPLTDTNPETFAYRTLGVGNATLDTNPSGNESITFTPPTAFSPTQVVLSLFNGTDRCVFEGIDAETGELLVEVVDVEDTAILDPAPGPQELRGFDFANSRAFTGRSIDSLTIKAQSLTGSSTSRFGFYSIEYNESLDQGASIGSSATTLDIAAYQFALGNIGATGTRPLLPGEELQLKLQYRRERNNDTSLFAAQSASTNELVVPIRPIRGFQGWSAINFGVSFDGTIGDGGRPGDDPDKDGFINIEEFVFGTNPRVRNNSMPPNFMTSSTLPDGRFQVRFVKRVDMGASILFTPEVSTNLQTWRKVGYNDLEYEITEEPGFLVVTSRNPVSSSLFFRLNLKLNSY